MRPRWWLILLPLPLLAGERNPFMPPEDRCQTAQLAQWRYAGALGGPDRWIGVLQDHSGKWRRVRAGDSLAPGWQVRLLTAEKIAITTGPGCEPAGWVWLREGGKKDAMDKPAVVAGSAGAPAGDGEKRSSRHPGGG